MQKIFYSQDEFNQASLDNVARLLFDVASDEMSDGHNCSYIIQQLKNLSNLAVKKFYRTDVIGRYIDMLESVHKDVEFVEDLEGFKKDD